MTSGVYERKPGLWAGNGGARRNNTPPPKLDAQQAEALRLMHEQGVRIKLICRAFNIAPCLLYRVVNRTGAYKETK